MPKPVRPPSGIDDSWTDDLLSCPLSGIGHSTNIIYQHNGQPTHEHEFEDISFRFQSDDGSTGLYGIFDGHDGKTVADYAAQRLPAELMLGQLAGNKSDDEVKEILKQAFASVERSYFASIDDLFARRSQLSLTLPDHLKEYEMASKYPEHVAELKELNRLVAPGSSAIVALILDNRLFVANVGNCRALLCKTDRFGQLRVIQLNSIHDIDNPDEVLRLTDRLGMSVESVRHLNHPTRCLGDFPRKGGYKDHDGMRDAKSDPISADPDVYGSFELDSACKFLVLLSSGVSQALEETTNQSKPDSVNPDVAALTVRELVQQVTMTGVAQAVVDHIARQHHDMFFTDRGYLCQRREDMTVLVRKFDYPQPPPMLQHTDLTAFRQQNTMVVGGETTSAATGTGFDPAPTGFSGIETGKTGSSTLKSSTGPDFVQQLRRPSLKLDEQGRIEPYVDFSEYFEAVQRLRLENE